MCLPYRTRVKKRKRTRWRSINSADQPPPPTRNQHESISVASCPPRIPLPTLSSSLLLLSHWRPLKATVVFIWTASISKANKEYKLSRQPAVDNMQHQPPPVRPAGPTLFPFYRSSCFLFPFVHFLELFVFFPRRFSLFFHDYLLVENCYSHHRSKRPIVSPISFIFFYFQIDTEWVRDTDINSIPRGVSFLYGYNLLGRWRDRPNK